MTATNDVEDGFFCFAGDLFERCEHAAGSEPSARLHILRALFAAILGLPADPRDELATAAALDPRPVDRSLMAAIEEMLEVGYIATAERFVEHAVSFPDDLVVRVLRYGSLSMSGLPGNRERAMALVEREISHLGGNWRFDGLLAFVRQEQRRFEDSRRLAEGVLAEQPDSAPAVHALTHVNYETGEHSAGIAWLDGWMERFAPLALQPHFVWHTALHELALGNVEGALVCYGRGIGPEQLIDAGSLLWRCRLAGADAAVEGPGVEAAEAARRAAEALPMPFSAFSVSLALAAAGEADRLAAFASRLEAEGRPAYADLVTPLSRALAVMLEQRPGDAVALLSPIMDDLARVGGSNAQREVVEDTLLRALVGARQTEVAESLLRARLERRPHALDSALLAMASVPTSLESDR